MSKQVSEQRLGIRGYSAQPTPVAPRLEIIHHRDPDSECTFSFYLNGELLKPYDDPRLSIDMTELDPGRGYEFSDWAGNAIGAIRNASPAVAAELYSHFESADDSYIDDLPATNDWLDHLEDTPENREWWTANFPDIPTDYLF